MIKGSKAVPVSDDSARWQAESDARRIREYQELMNDPKRIKAATAHMKKEVTAMQRALGTSSGKAPSKAAKGRKG